MKWLHASYAGSPDHSGSAFPGLAADCPLEGGGTSGAATPTARTEKRVALLHLQLRRDLLADRLRRLQRGSRNREASTCSRELRAVTTELMKMGRA